MNYDNFPIVKKGDTGPNVSVIKAILRSQGLWDGTNNQIFGPKLEGAVQYFQSTHLGPHGEFLQGDGEVGPKTWWALYNPVGIPQESGIEFHVGRSMSKFYKTLSQSRVDLIGLLAAEHRTGIKEIPDGANSGDGVDKYIEGFGPAPWCCLLVSWAWKKVSGKYPLGTRHAHVRTFWNAALSAGIAKKVGTYSPVPGDFAVWLFSGGSGHISTVIATNANQTTVNTFGGNEGNRLKLGCRSLDKEPKLAGFINIHGDFGKSGDWTKKLFSTEDGDLFSVGSTR